MKKRIVFIATALFAALCLTACAAGSESADVQPAETTEAEITEAEPEAVDGVIVFNDDMLENLVREAMNKPDGDILVSDAQAVTELDFQIYNPEPDRQTIHNLDALQYFTNLTYLGLGSAVTNEADPNAAVDLSALSGLTKLESLQIGGVVLEDVSALSTLTNLKSLTIWGDGLLSDISPLSDLTNLEALTLRDNRVSDVLPLSSLTKLTYLDLENNQITDVSPLASLTNLTRLSLAGNPVEDYSPLAEIRENLVEWDFEIITQS